MLKLTKPVITVLLLFCLTISASASGAKETVEGKELKILYVPGVSDPFYYSLEKGAQQKAAELGIHLSVSEYPVVWDPKIQIPILNKAAAADQYDLILIAPTANDALITPLKKLYDKGIQIITVDTKIGNGIYSEDSAWAFPLSHIGTDNFDGGVRLAEYLAEQVHETGKIYINTTTEETSTTEERKDGFLEGISHFPDMEVVRVDYNGDVQTVAMKQTLTALMEFPDLVAVFGTNVFSSQGVSAAVRNTGLSGAVRVAAWDATIPLMDNLRNGEVDLVLAQKPAEIGSLAVEWGYNHFIKSMKVPKSLTSGYVIFTQSNMNDPGMAGYIY